MCVLAIDPANRARIVGSQIGVFSLFGRSIRVLVGRGRIMVSGGIRVLTSLLGLLVVPTVAASAAVLLALVALVVLVLLRVLLSVNLPLDSRWILRLRVGWSRLQWMICRWRLRRCSNLRGLLIVLWSGLWVCRRGWCNLLVIVGLRCDRGGVSRSRMTETLWWT